MKDARRKVVINLEIKNPKLIRAIDRERLPLEWSRADVVRHCLRQRYKMPITPPEDRT
jgi:hypothetical protein